MSRVPALEVQVVRIHSPLAFDRAEARMRIVVKKYLDGEEYMYETSDDGEFFKGQLGGTRGKPGKRTSVYLDMTCDEDEQGLDRLLEAISWMRDEVVRRRQGFAVKAEKNQSGKRQKMARGTKRG